MPIIKSAKKRVKTSRKRAEKNKVWKDKIKNTIKEFEAVAAEGNKEKAEAQLSETKKILDKAADRNILHKNNVSRKKSRLEKMLNNMN